MLRFIFIVQSLAVTITAAAAVPGNDATSGESAPEVDSSFWMNGASTALHDDLPSNRQLQKIIGGERVNVSDYPWYGFASFVVERANNVSDNFLCGSAIIHSDIVVSTANCIVSYATPRDATKISVTIFTGYNRTDRTFESAYSVTDIYYPKSFFLNIDEIENNIVFYKLSESTSVSPIIWNTDPSIPSVGDILSAFGYGVTANDGNLSDTLQKVDLSYLSNAECREAWFPIGFRFFDESTMCADADGKGPCRGDSGGPLVTQDGVLVGMISVTRLGACDRSPTLFTRISYYSDMISSVSRARQTHRSKHANVV